MRTPQATRWTVVLPVKRRTDSKTRLGGADRADLALAFATDTMAAVSACHAVGRLVVVTDDADVAQAARGVGASVVDERHEPGVRGFGRLNAAIRQGVRDAGLHDVPVAALTADLPALRPAELASALDAAGAHPRAFVADHSGTGTSMVTSRRGDLLDPHFGEESAAAHARSGAQALDLDAPGLRLDVDTPRDLEAARRLGCGPVTIRLLQARAPGRT